MSDRPTLRHHWKSQVRSMLLCALYEIRNFDGVWIGHSKSLRLTPISSARSVHRSVSGD